jgi:hypothetical protein
MVKKMALIYLGHENVEKPELVKNPEPVEPQMDFYGAFKGGGEKHGIKPRD